MGTGQISEMLVFDSTLTRLTAQEDFSAIILCENFKYCMQNNGWEISRNVNNWKTKMKISEMSLGKAD
jgi:hypothetical protein